MPYYRKFIKNCVVGTLKGEAAKLIEELFAVVKRSWTGEVRSIPTTVLKWVI